MTLSVLVNGPVWKKEKFVSDFLIPWCGDTNTESKSSESHVKYIKKKKKNTLILPIYFNTDTHVYGEQKNLQHKN